MINFKNYLVEEAKGKKLTHLIHTPDYVIHGDGDENRHEGVRIAAGQLKGLSDKLLGRNNSINATTKFDGAPSVVYGNHPETGQFFVGTKGVFNKNPKLAFSHEDIDKHYGHAPGLAAKMHEAFDHLQKIMPRKGGVYQGDLKFGSGDLKRSKGMVSWRPNTLEYSAPENSAEGQSAKNAKIGFVTHTEYGGGKSLESMSARPLNPKKRAEFQSHPDVYHIDPTITINPSNYTPEEQTAFANHMENARRTYAAMKPEDMDALSGHGMSLERHINQMVRSGGTPSVEGYIDSLNAAHQKDVDSVKTQAAKDRKIQAHGAVIDHIARNQRAFKKALELHGHLTNATQVLNGVMAKNSPFTHTVNGEATGPEGAVVYDKEGNSSKIIDRGPKGFANLNLSGMGAVSQAKAARQQVNEENQTGSHGVIIGGFSPYTIAHDELHKTMKQGGHKTTNIYTTQSSARPIPTGNKVSYIKTAVGPDTHVDSTKTPFHALSDMHSRGLRGSVTVYGGSDRAGMVDQLKKYNGVSAKHGHYKFDDIKFQQVGGSRSDDAKGLAGISGTKARAAKSPEELKRFLPKANHPQAEQIFKDIHSIKEDMDYDDEERRQTAMKAPETKFSSFMKQNTPLGTVDELGSALHQGRYKDAILPAAKLGTLAIPNAKLGMLAGGAVGAAEIAREKLKENTTGSVGGLGFNTGNPAADGNAIQQYIDTNGALAKDDENGNLIKMHNDLHAPLGFKEFDPKKDLAKGKK